MIHPTFTSFRWGFATRIEVTEVNVEFTAAGPGNATIMVPLADFDALGVTVGMTVIVNGATTAENNGRFTVAAIGPGPGGPFETIEIDEDVTTEVVATAVSLCLADFDDDGHPTWPVANLRAGGFDGGIVVTGAPIVLGDWLYPYVDLSADSTYGVDEYDWYVSQQSDDPDAQLWEVRRLIHTATETYSGGIRMRTTALATSEFPGITTVTPDVAAILLRNVHVYCRRRSDGAVQWLDLQEYFQP